MLLALTRDLKNAQCSQGTLAAGALLLQTIELPWLPDPIGRGGEKGRSCVPDGTYALVKHNTEAHPRSFALVNPALDVYHEPGDVPADRAAYARIAILLHVANFPHELQGCIGLGMQRGSSCVIHSAAAVERFNLVVPWMTGHMLRIGSDEGEPT